LIKSWLTIIPRRVRELHIKIIKDVSIKSQNIIYQIVFKNNDIRVNYMHANLLRNFYIFFIEF